MAPRAVLFATILGLGIAIPTAQLFGPRPSRFGWQMYAGIAPPLTYESVHTDGTVEPLDPARYFGNLRSDVTDIAPTLATHLCTERRDLAALRVTFANRSSPVTLACRR